ncbi:MAG TPA: glycosyltransferase family A protein [Mycobacteriales bacterium]|nr:glycosyltransferase family A protein [Mycobacteriales bacterium]
MSVLMPTYRQGHLLARAVGSLLAQTMADWELVVVDDGSPDDTAAELARLTDPRITVHRFERNRGLGEALREAGRRATGRYLAYLPSDDYWDPHHLADAVRLLDRSPEVYLAYGGVRWWHTTAVSRPYRRRLETPTLRGDEPVGRERAYLLEPREPKAADDVRSGNPFALAQVVHRRDLDGEVTWRVRSEEVSDRLELDFWRGLAERGAGFAYTGRVSCEWGDHPEQHHKIISGRGVLHASNPTGRVAGLSLYRQFYGVPSGEPLNWQPGFWSIAQDQRQRYGPLAGRPRTGAADGLKILLVGELGFNPERILALREAGHRLYGLWIRDPQAWMTVGPLPFAGVQDLRPDDWRDEVRRIRPDVIYALLNWQALPLIAEVLDARLGVPVVFHFKESPQMAMEMGHWRVVRRLLRESAGLVLINQECRDWFEAATGEAFDDATTLLLDGDLPAAAWATDDWAPPLSERDGEIHTVCVGRVRVEGRDVVDSMTDLARAGIHVHLYGETYQKWSADWVAAGRETGHLHLHPLVLPRDWVRELSQYDAAWPHVHRSTNEGDIRRAHWDDLNLPARLGTYAVAGLPWIAVDNAGHRVATQSLARRLGIGVFYTELDDLAHRLSDRASLGAARRAVRAHRSELLFDTHVGTLTDFFRKVAAPVV